MPNYGGGDLVEVRPPGGGETLLFPFLKAVITAIDLAGRRLIVEPPEEIGDGPDSPDEDGGPADGTPLA